MCAKEQMSEMAVWVFSVNYMIIIIIVKIIYYQMRFWYQTNPFIEFNVYEWAWEKNVNIVTDQPLVYDLIPHHIKINS